MKTSFKNLKLPNVALILAAICSIAQTGCVEYNHYNGVAPVSPMPPAHLSAGVDWLGRDKTPTGLPTVDSCQPTLVWRSADSGATKYDLMLCTAVPRIASSLGGVNQRFTYLERGQQVYYREGIEGTEHHLEGALLPGGVYVWSVRTHNGADVGPWSTYNFHELGLVREQAGQNLWWPFATPGALAVDPSAPSSPTSTAIGRIYFYREKRFVGSALQPHILLNSEVVGNSMNGGYFFVERPPGNYVVTCLSRGKKTYKITINLAGGETKYVRTSFMDWHVEPSLEDKDVALPILSKCNSMPTILR